MLPRVATRPTAAVEIPARRKHRVRLVAVIGAVTVAVLAVFGGIARTIRSDHSAAPTVAAPRSFTASGSAPLPKRCVNVPAQFEITVDAQSPADLSISATTRVDKGVQTTSVLQRVDNALPGTVLYAADVGPFDHAGSLGWKLLLNHQVVAQKIAVRCGRGLQPLPAPSPPQTP